MSISENKVSVMGLDGKEKELITIPHVFEIPPRLDLIERAVISTEAAMKQPQGRDPLAGKRNTAVSWHSGHGTGRTPRRQGSGYPGSRNGAFAPNTVGGRLAHPPRSEKVLIKRINKKERRLALLSAISATGRKDLILKRGHLINENLTLPIVIDDKIQTLKKTSQICEIFEKIGLSQELNRITEGVSIRSGKRKLRGHRLKKKKGPLIVIKEDFGIYKAARNIPGVEIVNIVKLNCNQLAPGTHAGRLVVWSQSAFQALQKIEVNL